MDTSRLLAQLPLFAGLGHDHVEFLARTVSRRDVAPLETIFWVGDSGSLELHIIATGRVEICLPDQGGREMRLAILGPGDFLGEISLLDGGPRSATARAIEATQLLVLSRESFIDAMTRFPSVALSVVQILSRRQRHTVEKLRGIRNINEVLDQQVTPWQKLADAIATMAASPAFLMTHAAAFALWIILNLALRGRAPDPFPFAFLCFWASVEAIFLSLFILISQATQGQKDRVRNEVEYQVALKLQLEMMQLHTKMDEHSAALARIELAAQVEEAPV